VNEVEDFPEIPLPPGGLKSALDAYGVYKEGDLEFTKEDEKIAVYYASLSVVVQDMNRNHSELPQKDREDLEDIISSVKKIEQELHPNSSFPYDQENFIFKEHVSNFPKVAKKASLGKPTLKEFGTPDIIHEWTVKPGKRILIKFLKKFAKNLKKEICGNEKYINLLGKDETKLVTQVASAIITLSLSSISFWLPFVALIAIILVRAGLKTLCEFNEEE
jgi:hypothetical protein